jgi:DNA-binding LacI/PurR family transcriptional regulator
MLLGVIVREITDPFFAMAIEALSTEALARGYNVVLGSAHSKADEAIALKAVLETRHCDAILLLGDMRDEPKFLEDLRASQTPVIALWHGTELEGVPTVNIDNRAGMVAALDHLIDLGHTRIAFIGGRPLGDIRERRTAYIEHLLGRGIPTPDEYVMNVINEPAGGDAALRTLMSLETPPTAIVCSTDHLAIGVLHAAASLGLNVPADLSVVGFDDIPMVSYTVPPLTTVRMPVAEMTAVAARLAMDEPEDGHDTTQSYVLTPTLVVRESTGGIPRQ